VRAIGIVVERSPGAGDRHDRGVAEGVARSDSAQIVKAIAVSLRALLDYALMGHGGPVAALPNEQVRRGLPSRRSLWAGAEVVSWAAPGANQ
jgi:hypothetical protein